MVDLASGRFTAKTDVCLHVDYRNTKQNACAKEPHTAPGGGSMHTIQLLILEGKGTDFSTRSYTGRGRQEPCLGVVLSHHQREGELIAHLLREAIRKGLPDTEYVCGMVTELSDAFDHMRSDSLGKGTIVYFPGIQWEES